jgi:hypothetical protein
VPEKLDIIIDVVGLYIDSKFCKGIESIPQKNSEKWESSAGILKWSDITSNLASTFPLI